MNANEKEKLKYRRQYLFVPEYIQCPFQHEVRAFAHGYYLYTHIDLSVTVFNKDGVTIVLLGEIFDFETPGKTNQQITEDLYSPDVGSFINNSNRYTGRYVLIYDNGIHFIILHDATATRKVFYTVPHAKAWFGSQPHLLARILNLLQTTDEEKLEYYHSKDFNRLANANVGDLTIYDDINQLIPNHYYDIHTGTKIRYWPSEKIVYKPVDIVANECVKMIRGYAEAIISRYKVMLPLTAGKDSRILYSAFKDIDKDIYYYINKGPGLEDGDDDIAVPQSLLSKMGEEFHVEKFETPVDPDFREIYFQNNPLASEYYVPHIFNYYSRFSDRINLPGNVASAAFEVFKIHNIKVTANVLARLNKLEKYRFAWEYYHEWLKNAEEICILKNIKIVNLFYWEERMGNWGTQTQMEKDIAQEDFNLFNSRKLMTLFLSVKTRYLIPPECTLHREILRRLWKDFDIEPLNPGFSNIFKTLLQKAGLLELFYKARFQLRV